MRRGAKIYQLFRLDRCKLAYLLFNLIGSPLFYGLIDVKGGIIAGIYGRDKYNIAY
jgi:hypothetical protein